MLRHEKANKERILVAVVALAAVGAGVGYVWLEEPAKGAVVGAILGLGAGLVNMYLLGLPIPSITSE